MTAILDLYILAKLDKGLRTPYDLQRNAGLSLGAIVPALRRLLNQKLVTRAEGMTSSKRPRHSYELTKAGKEKVATEWRDYFKEENNPTDLDALLRLVDVAQQYGAKKSRLVQFLKTAGKKRTRMAVKVLEGHRLGGDRFSYTSTRPQVEIRRLQAEEEALTAIAETAEQHRKQTPARKRWLKGLPPGQASISDLLRTQPKSPDKPSE